MFGGVTISKAAFINQRKPLSQEDKNEWQDVRTLIIDKISFMSDSIFQMLDTKLKKLETVTNLLLDSQSYLQETSDSLNLLVVTTKNSYFQGHLVDTGTTALMQLSYW